MTAPAAVKTLNVAVLYVFAAGDVSLNDRHCRIDAEFEHASRGTTTGADSSATEGGVVHVEAPVMTSIVVIWPLSVLVHTQLGFCASIVAVYADTLTGQFGHAAPAPEDKLVSKQYTLPPPGHAPSAQITFVPAVTAFFGRMVVDMRVER